MLTLRAAATRLAAVREYRDLRLILPPLGFISEPEAIDRAMRRELGLPEAVRRAAVAPGAGALRAILLDVQGAPLREVLGACARRFDSRTPHLRVLLVALAREPLQLGRVPEPRGSPELQRARSVASGGADRAPHRLAAERRRRRRPAAGEPSLSAAPASPAHAASGQEPGEPQAPDGQGPPIARGPGDTRATSAGGP